jgi:N6-L-threonylcarbamoyladenine synthase
MKDATPGVLALDTSNYTTSVAVVDKSECILLDQREILKVRQGERGLRQSHALFQHIQNLPVLLEQCFQTVPASRIAAVAVSDKPRPIEGSYMPVFSAGLSFGRTLAAALDVPLFRFSHQEGHLAAGAYGSHKALENDFLAFHLSGGTTELLLARNGTITRLGGTKDLSFGQVIDRIGVLSGLEFPAGREMDKLASGCSTSAKVLLKPIHFQDLDINLSGLETQAVRWIERESPDMTVVSCQLFRIIAEALILWSEKAMSQTGCNKILFTGGVASSTYIRSKVLEHFSGRECCIIFGKPSLSSDNAVGIGLLGVKTLWQ